MSAARLDLTRCDNCKRKIAATEPVSVKGRAVFCSRDCLEMYARGRSEVGTPVDDYHRRQGPWRP